MINLIPPHARKQVKIEYWVRAISVWILLAAAGLIIFAVLLVPSYVLINTQRNAYEASYAEAAANDASYKELEESVRTANEHAAKLMTQHTSYSYTDILDELDLLTGRSIVLTSIAVERTKKGTIEQIVIAGEAATRIDLVAYRDAIEEHAFFLNADLPLSDLAKDKEVPFSLTIAINQPEEESS